MTISELQNILARYDNAGRDSLIPILQDVQEAEGYVSRDSIRGISKLLNLPMSKIYGVATFYNQFRFQPTGAYHVQVCRGTACHVKGSLTVLEAVQRELGIKAGETTRDGLFSLEVVACIGACGLAPVMNINGEFYAKLTSERVREVLESCKKEGSKKCCQC